MDESRRMDWTEISKEFNKNEWITGENSFPEEIVKHKTTDDELLPVLSF